jgi:hypothetical protein
VDDYRRLLDSGSFYEQDAILSTHLLGERMLPGARDNVVPAQTPLGEVTRERDILRAELAATTVLANRALEHATTELGTAVAAAEADRMEAAAVQRHLAATQDMTRSLQSERAAFLASRSWRMTRPMRAISRRR